MDDPVWCAMAPVNGVTEREPRQFASREAVMDDDVLWCNAGRGKRLVQPKLDQNARCVGTELDARAFVDDTAARLEDM